MRIVSVILISAVLGMAVGAAVAYVEVRPTAEVPVSPAAATPHEPAARNDPQIEIDQALFNFGTMQRGTTKSHEFVVRNVGQAPLTLRVVSTTCKCAIGEVPDEPVPPGGSVHVRLEWSALVNPGAFRQTAHLATNDPLQSRVELSVEGNVTEASGVSPPDLIFDKVTAGASKSADVFVMALLQDELEVDEPTLSNEETREYFDVRVEPAERESLPNPAAKQGVRITVTAKPGLPLGRFDQWLSVKTSIPDAEQLRIPIIGRVVGNISIHGRLWNEDQGVLRLGHVKSSEGARASLNVVVRGEGAENVTLSVAESDPREMVAMVGAPRKLRPTLVHVPLMIEIPPGTPPMARLDTQQSDEARVVLKAANADVSEVVIGVRFAVER